ncbi:MULTISPECIES: hypothetical protein [Pseudomonas]|uniref:hypothetical protein n=1 Tax=Pseudomonas TaxID=286 RepID=UPI0002E24886|nr:MULTISPECIES: hypothetical protein [Pseudomonas]WOB61306.1 hypothetical protein NY023_12915 [Pseudomonas sp. NBB]
MDTNKMPAEMEAQFDAAFRAKFGCGIAEVVAAQHEDSMALMGAAMWAWQASREAVVVELPSPMDAPPYASYEGGWNDMRDEAVDGIEEQGLKVKAREVKP